jgi:hypothetical protein
VAKAHLARAARGLNNVGSNITRIATNNEDFGIWLGSFPSPCSMLLFGAISHLPDLSRLISTPNWQTMVSFLLVVDDRLVNEPAPEHILLLVWTQSRSSNDLIDSCYFALLSAP